ncbi:TetR/AcrR family transcriptional regulator [Acidovorax sp. sif1233]|nr:TetR/AcrR family transcriptional regulator [Acidovorax sp. sif0732]MBV7452507.1 TetR/AcrR family transcriptional regulator [Acidovorax sp. sif0715]MBV7458028.1 TetR/AcrR family transcriptional regulator [Acidovorax sp. sif1233]
MDSVHISPPMTVTTRNTPAARSTYRHGDLRRALLDAGIELARQGGPDAVVLREATRRAGVAPNAAYRHFANRDDLLDAVRAAAVAAVAQAMEAELAQVPATGTATEQAHAKVRAVGAGYLRFAHAETGLFRTAFGGRFTVQHDPDPAMGGATGLNPFQHLSAALDDLVTAGALPPERRPGAEYLAWSTVHGMALLSIDGPLRGTPQQMLDLLGLRLLDMVRRGL